MLGGDVNDIFIYNEVIDHLGLLELSLEGGGARRSWAQ